ncbi:MAG: hypothetical protein HYZ50_11400 [Deltaproteobacteria bacterium]|nr:hypothetical protein [Deltaproteobacteria bacterium]
MSSHKPEELWQPDRSSGRARRWKRQAAIILIALGEWLGGFPVQAQLTPGDILVADFEAGPDGAGLLFLVNPGTGGRTVLSDFGDPTQGPTGQSPFGVTVVDSNTILVIDSQGISGNGTLFTVHPTTGLRAVLSDFSNPAQGPLGLDPVGVTMGPAGDLLVTDTEAGTDVPDIQDGGNGALFSINPANGARALLSDFGNPAQGPLGQTPTGIARGAGGAIFVIDPDAGTDIPNDGKTGGNGALFEVNPTTGMRTLLSNFGNTTQGPTGVNPGGVALGSGGVLLVADTEAGTGGAGTLFSVDPLTGARTVLSNFGVMGQGATGIDPFFVAVAATGAILVTDDDAGTDIPLDGQAGGNGALFSVNPTNGNRTLLSDFGNMTQGPTGVHPVGVAIVPLIQSGDALVIDFLAGTNGAGALFSVNPTTGIRTLVSDFGNPMQGPGGSDPIGVALGTAGDILVVDEDGAICGNGALFKVNPINGARTLVSNFCSAAQGPTGENPHGVALEADGNILVTDRTAGTGISGALFRVNPLTGARTLLSDFGNTIQGPIGSAPAGVIPDTSGDILIIDPDFIGPGGVSNGGLFIINPVNGMRTLLSDFNDIIKGPTGQNPEDVTLDTAGHILVTDQTAGTGNKGTLFSVNPMNGMRIVVSDFGNAVQGSTGQDIEGVVVRETGDLLVIDDVTGTSGAGTLFSVNPTNGMRTVVSDLGNPGQGPIGSQPVDVAIFSVNSVITIPLNHFLCYRTKGSLGNRCTLDSFNPRAVCETEEDCGGTEDLTNFCERFRLVQHHNVVTLSDQFEAGLFEVQKPVSLCNPTDKNGEDPAAPADPDHLEAYQIALVPKVCVIGSPTNEGKACRREQDCGGTPRQTSFCQRAPEHVRQTNLTVENQFGSLQVDTLKPDRLLVPTAKSLSGPVPAPTPGIDHFKCYSVRVTPGTPKFLKDMQVFAVDQFQQPTLYDIVKPTRLCAPVNKENESPGVETHAAHLMCYQVKAARGQPKHMRVPNIYTNNQFGPELLDTTKEEELCAPSQKILP